MRIHLRMTPSTGKHWPTTTATRGSRGSRWQKAFEKHQMGMAWNIMELLEINSRILKRRPITVIPESHTRESRSATPASEPESEMFVCSLLGSQDSTTTSLPQKLSGPGRWGNKNALCLKCLLLTTGPSPGCYVFSQKAVSRNSSKRPSPGPRNTWTILDHQFVSHKIGHVTWPETKIQALAPHVLGTN